MNSIGSTSRGRSSKQVERPLETRGVAGSSPADHIAQMFLGSVAQRAERPTLNRRRAGSSPAGVTYWKDCHWCGTPFRKRVGLRALGVRLPLLPLWRHGRVERQRVATARAGLPLRRFESCCLRLSFRRGRAVRRATVTREAQVRSLPPESADRSSCPRGRIGDDAGLSIRKLRVRIPPGVLATACRGAWPPRRLWAPEIAGSTPAGQTCAVEEGLSSRAS